MDKLLSKGYVFKIFILLTLFLLSSCASGRYSYGIDSKAPYSKYTKNIISKIQRNFSSNMMFGSLRTIIYFQINRDGTIDNDIKISKSSGNNGFDQNAINAVKSAAPFKPLPMDFKDNSLSVYFEFKWQSEK